MPVNTPPPHKTKGAPPTHGEAKGNLDQRSPSTMVALNFRVTAELKKRFRVAAAELDITQVRLLEEAFEAFMGSKK